MKSPKRSLGQAEIPCVNTFAQHRPPVSTVNMEAVHEQPY